MHSPIELTVTDTYLLARRPPDVSRDTWARAKAAVVEQLNERVAELRKGE